jgi:predicted MFS family arabinose efflux permease
MKIVNSYIDSYRGLSNPAWILALVILINRAGAMVLPFLSLYLREDIGLDLAQVGIILSLFGVGSLVGSFTGGWLTDRFGSFAVQTASLVLGGLCFLILKEMKSFESLAVGFFLTTVITDSLRPANSSAVAQYSNESNLTRAYSLNRMATNLGYTIGPAIGGILATQSYSLLFYADAFSCIVAGIVFFIYFLGRKGKTAKNQDEHIESSGRPPWLNFRFMLFIALVAGYGTVFFQLFMTLPLYYRASYLLDENTIGWLLALNGFVVFLIEMPLVARLENRISIARVIIIGTLLAGLGLVVLNLVHGLFILILSMILLSVSEILAMPFMTTYVVQAATEKSRGRYLGMYSVGYSLAFIAAPAIGTSMIDFAGYASLWYTLGGVSLLLALGFSFVIKEKTIDAS